MDENTMRFISKEARIEDSAGRRKFRLALDNRLKEYEKGMLCRSRCPHILPMHVLNEDGEERAYYDFTGTVPLTEYLRRLASCSASGMENKKAVGDALDALSGILGCIKGMENHLVFPERIAVHPDAVFVDPDNGKIFLAFYPLEDPETTFQSRILSLVDAMKEVWRDPETAQYFEKFREYIQMRNPGLDGMIAMLDTLRREVGYIYWNSGCFREPGDKEPGADHGLNERTTDAGRFTYKQNGMKQGTGKNRDSKRALIGLVALQAVFAACFAAAFLSDAFDIVNLAGMAVIAAAIDLSILRKLQFI